MNEQTPGYPVFSFDYKYGTIEITLPNGKKYVFSSPGGHYMFNKWKAQIKAHPSNGWRLLTKINELIKNKTPNWSVVSTPDLQQQIEPGPTQPPAPAQFVQKTLF
jgi:hypothetical protein